MEGTGARYRTVEEGGREMTHRHEVVSLRSRMAELPSWYREWPDATTDAILRIDAELAKTQALRDMINRDALCVVCGEHGLHTHWGT